LCSYHERSKIAPLSLLIGKQKLRLPQRRERDGASFLAPEKVFGEREKRTGAALAYKRRGQPGVRPREGGCLCGRGAIAPLAKEALSTFSTAVRRIGRNVCDVNWKLDFLIDWKFGFIH